MASSASPEFIAFIATKTRLPATCVADALNFATTAFSSCSFSGETTNDSCWLPAGAERGRRAAGAARLRLVAAAATR